MLKKFLLIPWTNCTKYLDAVIAQKNEIFLLFRTIPAISGHGCHEKPETCMDACRGRLRPHYIYLPEQIENPFDEADSG